MTGIYKIQSQIKPERMYIGSATNIRTRWNEHKFRLKKGSHSSGKLQNHVNKYGLDDLLYLIIEDFEFNSKEYLLGREQYYLDTFNPYFNILRIAGSSLGMKHTEEHKKKMSEMYKGKKPWNNGLKGKGIYKGGFQKGHIPWHKGKTGIFSDEIRKKISDVAKITLAGRPVSIETRKKIGIANKKRKITDETKLKMRLAKLGKQSPKKGKKLHPLSEDHKRKIKESMINHFILNKNGKI